MGHAAAIPFWAAILLAAGLVLRIVVGASVLSRAARIRGRAELAIGGFILSFALGELLLVVASRLREGAAASHAPLIGHLSLAAIVVAIVVLAEGLRRLFRPDSRGVRVGVGLLGLVVVGAAVQRAMDPSGLVVTGPSFGAVVMMGSSVLLDVWWAAEAFTTGRRLRKQASLGLASGETSLRFDLWGVAACAHGSMPLALLYCMVILRRPAVEFPVLLAALGIGGIVTAFATYASFHPPRFLRERSLAPTKVETTN